MVDGEYRSSSGWSSSSQEDILVGSCSLTDRCSPSPCEHGGTCKQKYDHAYCDCHHTGYSGAVCHTSLQWRSCMQLLQARGATTGDPQEVVIDLDGSGPLPPVSVVCEVSTEGEYVTSIKHSNQEATKVDGFQARGSFHQVIHYHATEKVVRNLLNRSTKCWQSLSYDCKQSRLFDSPVKGGQLQPYGWWVSWQNKKMDYWPGSSPGSRQCACGLRGDCYDPDKVCNCDSGHDDWLQDGGDITSKEHLPVRALHFGDTGTPLDTKEGRFSLGQLKCSGDTSRFSTETGVARLQRVINKQEDDHGHAAEVFFEFSTEVEKSAVLFYERVDRDNYCKVVLVSDKRIVYEWSTGGRGRNITVEMGYRLNDGRWHTVNIEHNIMEVMVVVDREEMMSMKDHNQKLVTDTSYSLSELQVNFWH